MKWTEVLIKRARVSDQIKDALKQTILSGEFKPGEKLPREDQIAATFKVSKVSVREALRDLEGDGIIEKRRGIFGGNFVAQPGVSKMDDLMANYYQFGTITPQELLEFAQLLEPTLVSVAVRRRTDKDLEKIRVNIEEREQCLAAGKISSRMIPEFHGIVADSCQNQLFSVVMRSLMNVAVKLLPQTSVTGADYETHLLYSKELYDCMVKQDEKAAQALMMSIFEKFMEILRRDNEGKASQGSP
jgi:GntR family transcriptional regulator, transcriptional repressor for pyruvate dehydrogenase complex